MLIASFRLRDSLPRTLCLRRHGAVQLCSVAEGTPRELLQLPRGRCGSERKQARVHTLLQTSLMHCVFASGVSVEA